MGMIACVGVLYLFLCFIVDILMGDVLIILLVILP